MVFDNQPFKLMVMNGATVAAFACALFLVGCQNDLYEGSTAPDEYWISEALPATGGDPKPAIDSLAKEAARLCPAGYHKFAEQIATSVLRWGIHCGDTFGDDSVAQ